MRSNERNDDRPTVSYRAPSHRTRTHALGLHHTTAAFPSLPLPRPRPRPPSYPVNPLAKMTHDATAASTVNPFRLPGVIRCHPSGVNVNVNVNVGVAIRSDPIPRRRRLPSRVATPRILRRCDTYKNRIRIQATKRP